MLKERLSKQYLVNNIKSEDIRVHKDDWLQEEFKQKSQKIYIKQYIAGPLEFEVSLMNKATYEVDKESHIFKIISSLGLVISSIDEAPIKLNSLTTHDIFGDQQQVIQRLRGYHFASFQWNILKIIGASNLLGNPMNLVNSLGTGVQDFFYEPR